MNELDPAGDAAPVDVGPEEDSSEVLHTLPRHPGVLERFAVRFLTRRDGRLPPSEAPHDERIHVLTHGERLEVHRVVESTITRAFLAGVLSALLPATTEVLLAWRGVPHRLAWMICASLVATVFEVIALFRQHLYAMLRLMRATGARLADDTEALGEALANAMARAALEIQDPVRIVEGINPWRETSRLRLVFAVVVYKMKRGLTNFLAKTALRQVAPNALLRTYVPVVSLPITGAWNAFVSWRILREARIRVLGPSAVEEVYAVLIPRVEELTVPARMSLFRAVGMGMVLKRSVHPNLLAMLKALIARIGTVREEQLDSRRRFLDGLAGLSRDEQRLVLQVLQVAVIIDGRLVKRERVLVREARRRCGLSTDLSAVERLLSRFSRGDPIDRDLLGDLAR